MKSGGGVDGVGDDNLFMFVFVVEWNFSSAFKTGSGQVQAQPPAYKPRQQAQ